MKYIGNKSVPQRRDDAINRIDREADLRHAAIRRGSPHVFLARHIQAREFLLSYPTAAAAILVQSTDWPMLAAYAEPVESLWDVAQAIVTAEKTWIAAAARIERARLDAHRAIKAATTADAVAAVKPAWPPEPA